MTAIKNNRPVIVGIFILIGIAILIATIFTLGSQKKTFVQSITIHAVFKDVSGLLKGGNVWLAGVKIGTVKKISFIDSSMVDVTLSIEKDAQPYIHKNAEAKIGSDGLIGNKIVIIYGGNSSVPIVEKNDYLKVESATSTDDMLATLQANNKNLLAITGDFKSVSKKIDSGKGLIGTLLNDTMISLKLHSTMNDLQSTIANFKAASMKSKMVLAGLQDFTGKLNKPGNSVNELVSDTGIYKSINSSLHEINNATMSINQFTANLKTMSDRLNQKDNALNVLTNDSAAANSLKATLTNLQSGSHKLDQDLEALQHNFLLRGFFKKKNKTADQPQNQ